MILVLIDRCDPPAAPGGRLPGTGEPLLSLLRSVCAPLGLPQWEVNLVLVKDEVMAELNESFRRRPGVTDVLSFSYLDRNGRGEPALSCGRGTAACDLWAEDFPAPGGKDPAGAVGEVIIAPAYVADCCRRAGWSADAEFALLVIHGCLHLLGWQHGQAAQQRAMQTEEERLLAALGMKHPLLGRS